MVRGRDIIRCQCVCRRPREESQRSKGDSFRFLEESTRRRASASKKAVGGFDASPKKKNTYAPFSGARLIPYAFQSRKTANANVGKKVPARNARVIHAPRPSARSRPCPCPGGSAPRYPAPPRPPSRTLMLVTTAQPRRARLSRFRSFPASRGWKENGKRLVTDSAGRFLVRARGRGGAGWSLPAGTRARRWLDVVAARLASPERSNPEVATPRHEPGRVAGRPHSPREALKTTTRTRANE